MYLCIYILNTRGTLDSFDESAVCNNINARGLET